jgi:ADP-ribose pyrophosphatase
MRREGSDVHPWETLETEPVYDCRVFSVLRRRNRSPRTGGVHDFHVLEAPDWVNIVPITAAGQVVMVRQYRHGIADVTLEIPGGMVDAADASPLAAARREMVEETGYDSDDVVPLGAIHPNPALQGNRCHTFLARSVVPRGIPVVEGTEHTEPVLVPLADIPDLIRRGTITHALVVVAFHWLLLHEPAMRERIRD